MTGLMMAETHIMLKLSANMKCTSLSDWRELQGVIFQR